MTLRERAPAKANLVLWVGEEGPGGLHSVCSLFAALDLADDLLLEEASADEVVCPGVAGENLAARALAAFRAAAPQAQLPPIRVTIHKRIPVAAGLAGGSADAAAVLRAANELAGGPLGTPALRRVAAALGSDVPSQVRPSHALVTGTGEGVEPLELPAMTLVLVPAEPGLSTAAVFAELDRLRAKGAAPPREGLDPEPLRRLAAAGLDRLAAGMENDLQAAALSLRPELEGTLDLLRRRGSLAAQITGSGPTAVGAFQGRAEAESAAEGIEGAVVAELGP